MISADPFLRSEEYINFSRYTGMTDELKKNTREKRSLTQGFENAYLGTNPFLYSTYSHLGDYYNTMEDFVKACSYYKLALAMEVAGENIRKDLEAKFEESLKKSKNGEKGN
jgi:hypothetical protein